MVLSHSVTVAVGHAPSGLVGVPERTLGHYTHEKNPVACAAALAADSLVFTDAYATSPVCSPSRARSVTGTRTVPSKITARMPSKT